MDDLELIKAKDWSSVEGLIDSTIQTAKKNEFFNLGIYRDDNGYYQTSGLVGISRLKNSHGNNILNSDGKPKVLKVEPRFGVDPFSMLDTLKDDEEFGKYLLSPHSKNGESDGERNEIFHIYNDAPIRIDSSEGDVNILGAVLFLRLLTELCKRPLYGRMERIESNLVGQVKGKILFNKHIKHNVSRAREERVYCQHQHYTVDVSPNQILKYALKKVHILINDFFEQSESAKLTFLRQISFCGSSLKMVSDIKFNSKDCINVNMTGFYAHYKPVISAARMILEDISIDFSGECTLNYILPHAINMQKIFEFYVRARLKKYLQKNLIPAGMPIDLVDYQDKFEIIEGEREKAYISGVVIPDIIIRIKNGDGTTKYRVYDVKYKDGNKRHGNREDRLQLLAYGLIYNCDQVGHIFPCNGESTKNEMSDIAFYDNKKTIKYHSFFLSSDETSEANLESMDSMVADNHM